MKREPAMVEVMGARTLRRLFLWLTARWATVDVALYVAFAGAAIGFVGGVFVTSMLHQTHGTWSAPLDDVFIHFDFARATARGYPFQWSEGNGYSSGDTSITYPLALAVGYRVSFTGPLLMKWALGLAGASMLAYFAMLGAALSPLGRWAKYVLPPATLSLAALDWSLASGMENAFHLGVFALAFGAVRRVERSIDRGEAPDGSAWLAGAACAALVLTRPESCVCVAAFAGLVAWAAWNAQRHSRRRARLATLVGARVAAPTCVALVLQAGANRIFTGEWTPSGAISKLVIYDPYLSRGEKWAAFRDNLAYAVGRLLHHHFADLPCTWRTPYAAIPVGLALVPLLDARVRRYGVALWAMAGGWLVLVAWNEQVRWQNERYLMAPAAWLFSLAGFGLASLLSRFGETLSARARWGARAAVGALGAALFVHHQMPCFRDQVWFYGRAARNILDQQITAGMWLRSQPHGARRVLVGDAGAITYASDLPGLDAIGLGGYHDLPFAAARRHGVGATLELVERMPEADRPDVLAIYPSWWGELPTPFGRVIHEVPVRGNVICGGPSKVIYAANWRALDTPGRPRSLRDGEVVSSELDVADLVSERERGYAFDGPLGRVTFRVLDDPEDARRDLFDAGRTIAAGDAESATFDLPQHGGRLIVRTVAVTPLRVMVRIGARDVGELVINPATTWTEASVDLPAGLPPSARVALAPIDAAWIDFHVWIVESAR